MEKTNGRIRCQLKKVWFVFFIFLFGCAGLYSKPNSDLEARIASVEREIQRVKVIALSGEAAATDRVWPFYGLTGGGNALDGITEGSIGTNDFALGRDSDGYGYLFYWNATDTNSESAPSVIKPNGGDGTGSWLSISRWYAESFYSTASDGEHYVDVSNTTSLPAAATVGDGAISSRDDRDGVFTSDGTSWLPLYTGSYADCTTSGMDCDDSSPDTATIPANFAWGGLITNNGAIGNVTMTLPSAVSRMKITIVRIDSSGQITIEEGSGDVINGATTNIVLDTNGESVTLRAIDSSTWAIESDSKSPTYNN